MAYNPFNIFRRNQKAIFAVITVFIMFTFVLSSGLGGGADFFDWLPRWLGAKGKKGDVVCTIDGNKVYDGELRQARYQRVMANRYMSQAALYSRARLDDIVTNQLPRLSPEARMAIQQVQMTERFLPQFGPQAPIAVQNMKADLLRIVDLPTAKAEDKEAARVKIAALSLLQAEMMGQLGGTEQHYFGNAPNRTNRDLVNFMLWQKKADQLGIKLTTDDVKRLIDKEF